jgi:hypothetical protein
MLPLEGFLLIPSLIVAALILAVAYYWRRRSASYATFWKAEVALSFLITLAYTMYVLAMPFYSQQDHSPRNPGGFAGPGPIGMIAILFVVICLILPAFPTLLGLAFLPPRTLKSRWQSVLIVLYLAVVCFLIAQKYSTFMADYQRERAKPRQSPFERFEHLRRDAAAKGSAE